jgi:aspartyl-tRNA(Asn)/glutamyl-tRNA(Gln) amidotransferase subunit A
MNNYSFATIELLKKALADKEIFASNLVDLALERAKKLEVLGAVLEVFGKESILKDVSQTGRLAGIPGYIKDNICQKDRITSCASLILKNFVSTYDATAVSRLKKEGALLVGRTNMDEFAMGSSGETSAFGKTKNPWDVECVPGGSSSGSAAAVAAGLASWALGSDTGGSVRQPAAMCGLVGMKPTYGLVSRYGLIAYGSSLDTIGVLTRTVYDSALILSIIGGKDEKDSSCLKTEPKDYTHSLTGEIKKGLRIGVIQDALEAKALHPEIRQATLDALKVLEKKGATLHPLSIKSLEYCAASYFIISRAEAASNLARFDGVRYGSRVQGKNLLEMYEKTRCQGFGPEVKTRILMGNYVLSVGHASQFYDNAQRVRRAIRKEMQDAFKSVDLLVMPTHSVPAFKTGAYDNNKLEMDLQDYFTAPINLAGVPAISVPVGFTKDNKPLGMQLIGPHLSEELIFQTAHAYQQETRWHTRTPDL